MANTRAIAVVKINVTRISRIRVEASLLMKRIIAAGSADGFLSSSTGTLLCNRFWFVEWKLCGPPYLVGLAQPSNASAMASSVQ